MTLRTVACWLGASFCCLFLILVLPHHTPAADRPHRIWGKPSGVDGLYIPNGWLQQERLELAPLYPELTALDIELWQFSEGISGDYARIALQGFKRTDGGCGVYQGVWGYGEAKEHGGYGMRCFSNPAKELHCQLIGDVVVPMQFSCIFDPTPAPIGHYYGVPEEFAGWDDVFTYYYQLLPDINEGDELAPDTAAMIAELESLAGEGSMAWFSDMLAVVIYPTDEDGYTGVEILSGEPVSYYLLGRLGYLD